MIIELEHSRERRLDKLYIMSLVSCECEFHEGERKRIILKSCAIRNYGIRICMKCKDRYYAQNNKNKGRTPSKKEMLRLKTLNIGRKPSEETKRKMSLAHSGEKNHMYGKPGTWLNKKRPEHSKKMRGPNNHNWKPELTYEDRLIGRSFFEAKKWSNKIKEIYGWKCHCCGKQGYLESHHLYNWADFPEKRFDKNNGRPLCEKCHDNFHSIFGKKKNTPEQFYAWLAYDFQI